MLGALYHAAHSHSRLYVSLYDRTALIIYNVLMDIVHTPLTILDIAEY